MSWGSLSQDLNEVFKDSWWKYFYMAFSRLVYEAESGGIEKVSQGEKLPFNSDLEVRNIRVGEDGQWVIINYESSSRNSDGSVMVPRERVIRVGGPEKLS